MNIRKIYIIVGNVLLILLILFALGMIAIVTVLDRTPENLNLFTKMLYGELLSLGLLLIWFLSKK